MNKYSELSKINVNEHVKEKGRFKYLSWTWAVDILRKFDPIAIWEVKRFDGKPYLKTECGYFVEVAATVDGITLSQIHPVLDNNNKPITQPNSFQINTSIQRCLVKAIALHGLGLYIYAGEDLPDDSIHQPEPEKQAEKAPIPADGLQVIGIPDKVEKKSGTKDGKSWTRYGVTMHGEFFKTFSDTIGQKAEMAEAMGIQMVLAYKEEGKYKTIVELKEVE